jgi:hypothetical protein
VKTTVVNLRAEAYDIRIDRITCWGNPFKIGKDGDRATVIAKYEEWILTRLDLLADLPALRGKRLGCHCKPLACHGDVLARLADLGSSS